MPVERLREQLSPEAQLLIPLGRKEKRPKGDSHRPDVISIASVTSNASTLSTASSVNPVVRRSRPVVYSSDEDDHFQEAQENSKNDNDSEIEISSPKPRHPTKLPKVTVPPLQPFNGQNRVQKQPEGVFASHSILQGVSETPIQIPSNENFGLLSKTVTYGSAKTMQIPPITSFGSDDNMTPGETEQALKDLISGNINDVGETEIDPKDKIVDGFKPGIQLLDHQVVGRNWMAGRESPDDKRYGGILADDMGLGKTIQALARIVDNPATNGNRDNGWSPSTLVVCPLSLVGQWADEIKKMTKLTVLKHHGNSRTTDPITLQKHKVVVTTYDIVKSEYAVFSLAAKDESKKKKKEASSGSESDETEYSGRKVTKTGASNSKKDKDALFHIKWFRIVLDEAHTIKNHKTKGAVACCELKGHFKWCLTGTPLQNNVDELFSLLKFLHIRPWNEYNKFNLDVAQPIKRGIGAGTAMKRLQIILKQIMLRRRKDDILNGKRLIELPKRTVEIISCPFDTLEQSFYASLETKMNETLEKLMNSDKGNKYMSVLLLLLRLRQACNHPLLVTKDYKKDLEAVDSRASKEDSQTDDDDLVMAFGQLGVTRKCQMCMIELNPHNTGEGKWNGHCVTCIPLVGKAELAETECPTSAKIRMILKLLQDIEDRSDGEEKTIIFSQFTSMLDLIAPFLKEKGIRFVRYDGSMSPAVREAALAKIKSDPGVRVILISFKAGSTGLNLTACNNVILVDLWWNPALEDQAFDRAHRFGQKRDVYIYKLKIDETVEERILLLQDKKRALAQAALSGHKLKNLNLGMDDLLALFRQTAHGDSDDEGW